MRIESVVRNAQFWQLNYKKSIALRQGMYKSSKSSSNNLLPRNTQREVLEENEAEEMVL